MTVGRVLGYLIAAFGALCIFIAFAGIASSKEEPSTQPPTTSLNDAVSSVPEAPPPAKPEWQPTEPQLPNFADGQILNGEEYVEAFITANAGVNGFDARQLAYLGRESWESYLAAEKGSDSIFGSTGFDEMMKFTHNWHRLAEANHRNAISQQADAANALARRASEERDIDAGHIYKIGGVVTPPVLIHSVDAQFSPEARQLHIGGTSVFSLVVTTEGMPERIQLRRGIGHGLDEQGLLAIKQYRFKPSTKDGVPVPVEITIEVNFHIK